eukprot:gnl/TRDRNA2_/TRDRNA2_164387_c0_seq2.p1 gnl/TRDRNA2_/TRDRNA2_164387_c0~~gnl/TRDRNA2_/TRDRNA2_164387_c0_seq2.p1  ORF type:complete len:931 (-),score=165.28 gnl/TRDRNA2_/TRDRNA2_164387_c0_seq2:202-2994(-)
MVSIVSAFLQSNHQNAREAVNGLIAQVGPAVSGEAFFYSVPGGRGRSAVLRNAECSGFTLVASSRADLHADGLMISSGPPDHLDTLKAAVDSENGCAKGKLGCSAAAVVQVSQGVEGVLLVESTRDWSRSDSTSEGDLSACVCCWALILGERIEKLRATSECRQSKASLECVLKTVEHVLAPEKRVSSMENASHMIPQEILQGAVTSDRAALWFYDTDAKELVLNKRGHLSGIRVPVDKSIVGLSVAGGKMDITCVQDVQSDPVFNNSVDDKSGFVTKSSICVPIARPKSFSSSTDSSVAVVQLICGAQPGGPAPQAVDHFDLVCAEELQRSVLPTMLWLRADFMKLASLEQQRRGVEDITQKLMQTASVKDAVSLVETEVVYTMNCECCTVYLIDEENQQIWAPPSKTKAGFSLNWSQGIAGSVVQTARAAGWRSSGSDAVDVVVTNDPGSCSAWNGDLDPEKFVTKNIMTCPIWSVGSTCPRLLGVIQILNKRLDLENPQDDDCGFTNADARLLSLLSMAIGDHLQTLLLDMFLTKACMDEIHDLGMLEERRRVSGGLNVRRNWNAMSEYYTNINSVDKRVVINIDEYAAHWRPDLGIDTLESREQSKELCGQAKAVVAKHESANEWRIDYWALTEEAQFALFLQTMEECSVFSEIEVSLATMRKFFSAVKKMYRDTPYHNFLHALSTVHYSYRFLKAADVQSKLSKPDIFAMCVASLCHDIDHRGRNNAFEVLTRSDLAIRYNDQAPLENHHCAQAFTIILCGGAGSNIFAKLDQADYALVRKRMISAILATDMARHGHHVRLVTDFRLTDELDEGQKQFLIELFVHAADIGNQMMPSDIAKRWGKLISDEFTLQVEEERALGLPVTAFMDGHGDPVTAAKSNIGFIDFVVQPYFCPMCALFKGFQEPKENVEGNREAWRKVVAAKA